MTFTYPDISVIAVLVSAVLQFALGFLWYSPLTPMGARWMAEMKIRPDGKPGVEMLAFPIGSLVASWAAAMVYAWSGASGVTQGIFAAEVVGLAVAVQVLTASVANNMRSGALLTINLAYVFVAYAITGIVLGLLG